MVTYTITDNIGTWVPEVMQYVTMPTFWFTQTSPYAYIPLSPEFIDENQEFIDQLFKRGKYENT